jgi:ATP-dependent Clp protease ATP-binding subunit ClpC
VFERFTPSARQVVVLAQEEARTLKHNYIGTEHILLGLLREPNGPAARVLEPLDLAVENVRTEVVAFVGSGTEVTAGQIPFTPRAKKILEVSLREALTLDHDHLGTEHILLALARETDGVAARVLLDNGIDLDGLRASVLGVVADTPPSAPTRRVEGAYRALELAAREARREGRHLDGGDILLGLSSADGLVHAVLTQLGVDDSTLRRAVQRSREAWPGDA